MISDLYLWTYPETTFDVKMCILPPPRALVVRRRLHCMPPFLDSMRILSAEMSNLLLLGRSYIAHFRSLSFTADVCLIRCACEAVRTEAYSHTLVQSPLAICPPPPPPPPHTAFTDPTNTILDVSSELLQLGHPVHSCAGMLCGGHG